MFKVQTGAGGNRKARAIVPTRYLKKNTCATISQQHARISPSVTEFTVLESMEAFSGALNLEKRGCLMLLNLWVSELNPRSI
jgi:hypothetical protein